MKYVIVHYDEIALKKGNRDNFELILLNNLKESLGKDAIITNERDHFMIEFKKEMTKEDAQKLTRIPGVSFSSPAIKTELDIEQIKKAALDIIENEQSFKIDARRHNKNFKYDSMQLNHDVGEYVLDHKKLKVKMKDAEAVIKVEICNRCAYISKNNISGMGGLPTGSTGKTVALISGGIDSPVASYMMMKRGTKVTFVHFQNSNMQKEAVQGKVEELAKILSTYQNGAKLYIVPFDKIQKKIITEMPARIRMIIYKRLMLKISSIIADKIKAKAMIVGDNLAQVASQTMENMDSIYFDCNKMVFKPLIGMNKREIIDMARKIGTYEISIQPYQDCCSFFISEHPETRATREMMIEVEKNLDMTSLIDDALENVKLVKF
jgi:thiamine biosynthesis protein ThiI